jgi:hypothetical protein
LASFYINLGDNKVVTVTKLVESSEPVKTAQCLISLTSPEGDEQRYVVSVQNYDQYLLEEMAKRAPYMQNVGPDLWEDTRDGELLAVDEMAARFGLRLPSKRDQEPYPDWLSEIFKSVKVRLIESQRLVLQRKAAPRRFASQGQLRSTATVIDYAQQLAGKIQELLIHYGRLSQQLDRTFVVRLLKHDFTVIEASPENSVSDKVENLNQKRRRLVETGLLSKEDEALPTPEAPNPMIDQILSAYLQDVESKLAIFDTFLQKIELLKNLVDDHLEYKKMVISQQFGFQFKATYGRHSRILPANLSSGEQHILILFYDLLFNDSPNSIILIDEPEISLHVDWQLSFLADLESIVSIVPYDIILATHSPQIINNHWDLTVALNRPAGAEV